MSVTRTGGPKLRSTARYPKPYGRTIAALHLQHRDRVLNFSARTLASNPKYHYFQDSDKKSYVEAVKRFSASGEIEASLAGFWVHVIQSYTGDFEVFDSLGLGV